MVELAPSVFGMVGRTLMSSQPEAAPNANPQQLREIREGLEEFRKVKIEHDRADVLSAVEQNRQASTFYEKVSLVNGGTLAISLGLLGSTLHKFFRGFPIRFPMIACFSKTKGNISIATADKQRKGTIAGAP
jgi:hypothetical protein